MRHVYPAEQPIAQAGASSQEEYEESESEEDRVLTSSNENLRSAVQPSIFRQNQMESDSDDDENATALGRAPDVPIFRPQPNAFSHPPSNLAHRSHSTSSAVPSHPHSDFSRRSYSHRSHSRANRGAPNFMSPSYQADNDAALRASLTTLLSCAAAARGLPKNKEEQERRGASPAGVGPSTEPLELRLVPESELMTEEQSPQAAVMPPSSAIRKQVSPASSPRATSTSSGGEKTKRGVGASRVTKKKKVVAAQEEAFISPTLLSWVVSAGVVVLVSVVSFGAGYVIGREVGKQEALAASAGMNSSALSDSTSCGREVIRSTGAGSLRRFRWGTSMGRSVAA
jgi:hypothetical protein